MFTTLLFILALIAALISGLAALSYPFICKELELHLRVSRPDYELEKEAFSTWREKRWSLERLRLRVALTVIGAYAVGLFAIIPGPSPLPADYGRIIVVGVLTLSVWIVSIWSLIHSNRETTIEMQRRFRNDS